MAVNETESYGKPSKHLSESHRRSVAGTSEIGKKRVRFGDLLE